jgi:predicted nucleotidyltransferase
MAKINLAEDFNDFLVLCLKHKVKFLVIGGYAVVHYSRPRYTGDLDIWVESSYENAEKVVAVLLDFGFTTNDVTTEMITDEKEIIRMGFEPFRLELFTKIPGVTFTHCYPNLTSVNINGNQIPFIGLEDLKTNKAACGRNKDLQDLKELS